MYSINGNYYISKHIIERMDPLVPDPTFESTNSDDNKKECKETEVDMSFCNSITNIGCCEDCIPKCIKTCQINDNSKLKEYEINCEYPTNNSKAIETSIVINNEAEIDNNLSNKINEKLNEVCGINNISLANNILNVLNKNDNIDQIYENIKEDSEVNKTCINEFYKKVKNNEIKIINDENNLDDNPINDKTNLNEKPINDQEIVNDETNLDENPINDTDENPIINEQQDNQIKEKNGAGIFENVIFILIIFTILLKKFL